jgi:glycine cleavage system aminomethyltransferase T
MKLDRAKRSLQDLIDGIPNLVEHLHNDTLSPHFRNRTNLSAAFIPPEFSNWRDEQRAWRESAILFDQSHHMPEMFLRGPDAMKLLHKIAINDLSNFGPGRAKQIVAVNPDGFMIGECVAYWRGENDIELVSGQSLQNWVHFQAEVGKYDVEIERDAPTPYNPKGRRPFYRFQLDGPNAGAILRKMVGGDMPEIKFFRTATVRMGRLDVLVLRHGMAGHQGVELSGPYDEMAEFTAMVLEAGAPYGLKQGGTKAYFSALFEGGWFGIAMPAVFTGEQMRDFREWLDGDGWEANTQLAGSFVSDRIEDYYVTPLEVGYGKLMKFEHDFIGRSALEQMQGQPHRRKVTLLWNHDDVLKVMGSMMGPGPRYKAIDAPNTYYGFPQNDRVEDASGKLIGLSTRSGYSVNEGEFLSIGLVDPDAAEFGREVSIVWGEPDGGSRKPHVERHEMTTIRATIQPSPYSKTVQVLREKSV